MLSTAGKLPEQVQIKKVQGSQKSWVYQEGRNQEASVCARLEGWRMVVADGK